MITKENIWDEIDKRNYLEVLRSDLVDQVKDEEGRTPLHELAYHGVKEVFDHPSVDKVKDNYRNWTPLHFLAFWGYFTKKDLRKKYPWYKKKIKDLEEAVKEIVDTPASVRFILEDS